MIPVKKRQFILCCVSSYESWLKSSKADQDTLMKCDQIRFIFQQTVYGVVILKLEGIQRRLREIIKRVKDYSNRKRLEKLRITI